MILTRPICSILPTAGAALFLLALSSSCADSPRPGSAGLPPSTISLHENTAPHSPESDSSAPASLTSFDLFLQSDFPPADGFDFPVGDPEGKGGYKDKATGKRHAGWQVAGIFAQEDRREINAGEDWNGTGGETTDLGQPVYAVANGRVVAAQEFGPPWGKVVMIEHLFYENHEKKTVRSVYAHLDSLRVRPGEIVERRRQIGGVGAHSATPYGPHLHLEIRTDTTLPPTYRPAANGRNMTWVKEHYAQPSGFISEHRRLFVPQEEKRLVLIDQGSYRMRFYNDGKLYGEYDICFGEVKGGRKRLEGDKRTPRGTYFITEREQGEKITGPTAPYMGGYWLKLNYPNKYDAAWGYEEGHITKEEATTITSLWSKRNATPQGTSLGGGIGLHGWIREWDNTATRHRSWGCIVMHNRDIPKIYDLIPIGTMVVIW